jgi:TFIIF-interacting CTD phosphatase-like protein
VVLDIDQTLIYSTNSPPQSDEAAFRVYDSIRKEKLHVFKRPYLDLFLDELNYLQDNGIIELAIYTAGTQQYAEDILRHIDP